MEKKQNVPALRFQGFSSEWKLHSLNYYLRVAGEKNGNGYWNKDDVLSVSGEHGIVNQLRLKGRSFAGVSVLNYGVVHKGDVVYTKSPLKETPYGIIKTNKGKDGIVSTLYAVYAPKNTVDSDFVQCYFDSNTRLNNYLKALVNKGAKNDMKVSDENALLGSVIFPDKIEQEQLAKFGELFDKVVSLKRKKVIGMQRFRQAMLTKLFPREGTAEPELRFCGFSGKWHYCRFGDIASIRRGLTYSPSNLRKSGIRVLRSSNIQEDTFCVREDDVFVEPDAINIPMVKNGDILITAASGSTQLVGKHAVIDGIKGNTVVHGGFMLLASSDYPDFTNALMGASWYRRFIQQFVAGGNGAIGNLNKSDLEEQTVLIPDITEIKQIGNFFKELDRYIFLQQKKLERMRRLKMALLEKMFV